MFRSAFDLAAEYRQSEIQLEKRGGGRNGSWYPIEIFESLLPYSLYDPEGKGNVRRCYVRWSVTGVEFRGRELRGLCRTCRVTLFPPPLCRWIRIRKVSGRF